MMYEVHATSIRYLLELAAWACLLIILIFIFLVIYDRW